MPQHYRHAEVAALAHACGTEPLLSGTALQAAVPLAPGPQPADNAWLEQLDADPEQLIAAMGEARHIRLGLYFETLWHFYLQHSEHTELLAHNVPVRSDTATLGEFDCLYYCKRRQRAVHLELAVKFYLCRQDDLTTGAELQDWLGPNSRDRLARKLERMLHHQIALGEYEAAQRVLFELGIHRPLREVFISGQLFYHWRATPTAPGTYNSRRTLQPWLHRRELGEYLVTVECDRFAVLAKHQWLLFDGPLYSYQVLSKSQLAAELARDQRARLIAAIDTHGVQSLRFMVVADHWPADN